MSDSNELKKWKLYSELEKQIITEDYERAMKSCNRILYESGLDTLAAQCKIISCIQLSRFEDALEFASKNLSLTENLNFELAYCHYRLNHLQDALDMLENIKDSKDLRKKELVCQILYKLEKYEDSYGMYKDVCKSTNDDYDNERLSNLMTIGSSIERIKKLKEKNNISNLKGKKLPDPNIQNIDVESLESGAGISGLKYIKKKGTEHQTPTTHAEAIKTKKTKKKRKIKLPKNYDPEKPIDPERWLPRYERHGYKPKKSFRGRTDVGKGTQGVSSEAAEAYDMTKVASNAQTAHTPVTTPASSGGRSRKGKH